MAVTVRRVGAEGGTVLWEKAYSLLRPKTTALKFRHILNSLLVTRAHRAHTPCACTLQTWYRGTEVALWKMNAIAVLNTKPTK